MEKLWRKREARAVDEQQEKKTSLPCDPQNEEELALLEKYDHIFIGSFSHTLDSKGRMIVPLSFREGLGKVFCIGPSFNFEGICLYPRLVWAKMRDGYAKISQFDSGLKRYLEQFDAMSYRDQECDSQGRILLPAKIRKRILGDETEVEIAGNNDHVRIVAKPASEEQFEAFKNDLPGLLDRIDLLMQNMEHASQNTKG